VVRAWYPLGYNIRPRRLHAIAREAVARYGGRLPDDEAALRSLEALRTGLHLELVALDLRIAVNAVGEVVGELATRGRGRDRLVLRAGLTRALAAGVRADGAIAAGTTPASPDLLLTVGLTVELGGRGPGR